MFFNKKQAILVRWLADDHFYCKTAFALAFQGKAGKAITAA
jgi:hypothetical protein